MRRTVATFFLLILPLSATAGALDPLPGKLLLCRDQPTREQRAFFINLAGGEKANIVILSPADKNLDDWENAGAMTIQQVRPADAVEAIKTATGVWVEEHKLSEANRLATESLRNRGGVVGLMGTAVESPGLIPGVRITISESPNPFAETLAGDVGLVLGNNASLVARGRQMVPLGDGVVTACWGKSATRAIRTDVLHDGDWLDLFQIRRAAEVRAAKQPAPVPQPHDPVLTNGSLVIVGGGGSTPQIWKRFIELAGGPDELIVVIPTAMEDPVPIINPVEVRLLKEYGAKNVEVLHTRDRTRADDPKFSEKLTRAGGVWFGGGRQWRFVEAYEGTLTEKRFHDVLARGGVIGGSSAGASIQSEYMPRGHPLGNTVMMAEGYERGFGFLPGCAIDQHFFARKRTADMTALMKAYPQYLGIGIDEGTALVVRGSTAEVIGKSKVAFYDYRSGVPRTEPDYTIVPAGKSYHLRDRKMAE